MNVESNLTETMQEKKKQILSEDHLICLFVTVDKSGFDWKAKGKQAERNGGKNDGLKESRTKE